MRERNGDDIDGISSCGQQLKKNKPIRRARMNKRVCKEFKILYSNIQGFTGKKSSIEDIMQTMGCDICLLAETMTTNIKIDGAKCITPKKSVGQNVAIILRGAAAGIVPMKLYEPNETINMMGVRLEVAKNNFRLQILYCPHETIVNEREGSCYGPVRGD